MKKIKELKKVVVIYHRNCPDGFGGAWAAYKKFKLNAEYIPADPRELPNIRLEGKEIYVIDNSYSKEVLKELMDKNISVVVLDHHESSEDDVRAFPQNIFDNSHSGAVLAWKYFHPKKPVPKLLKYVEDNDLWKHSLPYSNDITRFISAHELEFKQWDIFMRKMESKKTFDVCVISGKAISKYFDSVVDEIVEKADDIQFGKYKVKAVNFSSKKFVSTIGNVLAKKFPPFGVVWYENGSMLHVSLRSDGTVDVSKIAEKYNGGGHKAAAAFKIKFSGEFPWKVLKSN
ncbi:MAG: DHHA1 domain-containing protein [bacterium]|nr:DHHA1 domain-containing protein [Candidatus Jorgensenbacteria bacterium]